MSNSKSRSLAPGYRSEFDPANEQTWSELLLKFVDANIYQTWQYASVVAGRRNTSHLILRLDGAVVAIAMARVKRIPLLGVGIAYIFWGPLWRQEGVEANVENFRQAVRALHNEFVCKRGLSLRLFPIAFSEDESDLKTIMIDEGLVALRDEKPGRTILIDTSPSLEELREGLSAHWKRELKVAEKNKLECSDGTSIDLFDELIAIYREMVSRKRFVEPNSIDQFRAIQARLPEEHKMRILLCRSDEGLCAGAVVSLLGNTAIYLFGATSNIGMKSRGSYLLQWKIIESLKRKNTAFYNLNGINPIKNPGTHKFKSGLSGEHGRDLFYMGRFDGHGGSISRSLLQLGDVLKTCRRGFVQRITARYATKSSGHNQEK